MIVCLVCVCVCVRVTNVCANVCSDCSHERDGENERQHILLMRATLSYIHIYICVHVYSICHYIHTMYASTHRCLRYTLVRSVVRLLSVCQCLSHSSTQNTHIYTSFIQRHAYTTSSHRIWYEIDGFCRFVMCLRSRKQTNPHFTHASCFKHFVIFFRLFCSVTLFFLLRKKKYLYIA